MRALLRCAVRVLVMGALAVGGVTAGALPAAADSTTVHPLDTLRLAVARWDAATGDLVPMTFLEGEFPVGVDGAVSLPVVGEMSAAGRSRTDLARDMERKLQSALGVTDGLNVSLTISEHGPVFVLGAVEDPGAYEFRQGLTVLQSVALAGGILRAQTLFSRTDRDAARALGDHRLLTVERWRALAKLARLEAELAGEATVPVPDELEGVELADTLLEVESEILAARQEDHQSALTAIEELKALLRLRIEKLQEEMTLRRNLLATTREERDSINTLVERGLSRRSQANEVSRTLAELEARVLELETTVLTAEQQLSEAERDRLELIGDRRVTIITELQDARTELNSIAVRLQTAEALYAEAARFGITTDAVNEERLARGPTFRLSRGSEPAQIVGANTVLRPGDVVEVRGPEIAGGAVPEATLGDVSATGALSGASAVLAAQSQ